jgi:hypothetical protein
MTKGVRELLRDLERDPFESTLRNVLSDLKADDSNPRIREYAEEMEELLDAPIEPSQTKEERVRMIIMRVAGLLRMHGRGRRRKTTRRR